MSDTDEKRLFLRKRIDYHEMRIAEMWKCALSGKCRVLDRHERELKAHAEDLASLKAALEALG